MIYFIQPFNGGLIKIGRARDPERRLRDLQIGCPIELRIIAVMPGEADDEAALHRQFARGRRHGEWFDPGTPGLRAFIRGLPDDQRATRRKRLPQFRAPLSDDLRAAVNRIDFPKWDAA